MIFLLLAVISLVLSGVLVGVDQIIKAVVVTNMAETETISVIPGLLNWTFIRNRGAAFGILQNQQTLFIILTSVMIVICGVLLFSKTARSSKWISLTLSLIIGGGIGNLIDRILTGTVIDYISVSFFPPIFNFADCCVVVGAIMALLYVLFLEGYWAKKKQEMKREETEQSEIPTEENGL